MTSPSVVGPTRSALTPPAAKLAPPALPAAVLPRPRLHAALSRAVRRSPLTLVSGPAGSGKTTLAASWWREEAERRPVAWLSVDVYDDDPAVLWSAVLEALVGAGVPREDLPALPPGDAVPAWFVPALAAAMAGLERPLVLVVDDADRLTEPTIAAGLDLLVRTAGAGLRLVLCARADPPLPVHRHRLAGTISEIGGDRLAFTPEETRDLLAALGAPVDPERAAALCTETRGWAVGLRLAAVPLRRGEALDGSATALTHDDGDIARYLVAEVLDREPPAVRRFLLRVSVTAELWPDLVARLTGRNGGGRVLAELARANAFVEAVPGVPGGYRLHPLFRETLQSQLAYERPQEVVTLHRMCARWYEDAGRFPEAIEHALAADDRDLVAQLLLDELAAPRWLARGTDETWRRVDGPLADGRGSDAAVLRAAAAVADGRDPDPRDLAAAAAAREEGDRPVLRASAALTCLTSATRRGDPAAIAEARAADPLVSALPADDRREAEAVLRVDLALGALATDAPAEQLRTGLRAAAATARDAGAGAVRSRAVAALAVLESLEGDLTRALRLAAESDDLAVAIGGEDAAMQPAAATAAGWAHLQRYELARAAEGAVRAGERAAVDAEATAPVLAVLRARLLRLRHEHDEAAALLDPWLRDPALPAWARAHILGEAVLLAAARGDAASAAAVLADAEDAPWRRRLLARTALLAGEPSAREAEEVEPTAGPLARVEALLLRAARLLLGGRESGATDALLTALDLARPELLRLPFLDAPPQARRVLRTARRLQAAAAWLNPAAPVPARRSAAPQRRPDDVPAVIEDLSAREREVLQHLAELLSTEEVAATMFVSVNTVRTHVRSILRKLGVTRRNDAVRRAKELGLL